MEPCGSGLGGGQVFEEALHALVVQSLCLVSLLAGHLHLVALVLVGEVQDAQAAYVQAVDRLMTKYEWVASKVHRRKMAREAARSVLPNATEVKIVVSGNVRAWRTMLELRLGEGAELEIRRMAIAVLRTLQQEAPAFFADFEIYRMEDGSEAGRVGYHKV